MIRKILVFGFMVSLFVILDEQVLAQRKLISSREYFDGVTNRGVQWYEESRRVETLEEAVENGTVKKSLTTVSEVLLPDRSRYYLRTAETVKVSEFDQITIDHMRYTRNDGGAWDKIDLRGQSGSGSGTGSGSGSSMACTQFSVEAVFLNGMPLHLYESLLIDGSGSQMKFTETRKWVSDEGLPHRTEVIKAGVLPRAERWREVRTYEYDPSIKIEAPIK